MYGHDFVLAERRVLQLAGDDDVFRWRVCFDMLRFCKRLEKSGWVVWSNVFGKQESTYKGRMRCSGLWLWSSIRDQDGLARTLPLRPCDSYKYLQTVVDQELFITKYNTFCTAGWHDIIQKYISICSVVSKKFSYVCVCVCVFSTLHKL